MISCWTFSPPGTNYIHYTQPFFNFTANYSRANYLFSFWCHCRDCDFVWFYIIITVAVFNKQLSRFLRNEQGPLVSWQRLAGTLPLFHCSDLRRRCLPVSLSPQCWVSGSRLRKSGVASVSEVSKLGLGASSWDTSLYPIVPGGQWGNSGKKGFQKLRVCLSSERADRVLPSGGMQCGANRKGDDSVFCVPFFQIMETDIFLPHLLGKGRPSCPAGWWLPLVISKPMGMTSSREHRVRSVYVFWSRWCIPISWNQRGVGWEKWHLSVCLPGTSNSASRDPSRYSLCTFKSVNI